ncbi:MAG TPA: hypothetical protein VJ717_04975, partial [Gemmatimonadaceae bacterium]|nr:hypothetical protein [Gemmatimonadaceae bacterium]
MIRKSLGGVLVLLAAIAAPVNAQGGSPWDRYVPGRLQAVIDANAAAIAENPGADSVLAISADDFPTQATLTYTGESRPLSPHKRDFLVKWLRSMGKDTALARQYSTEVHFREGTTSFWL